ncbi:MAG: hypothetical protein P8M63_11995 [Paracoccaceae bacterium]|nr:hypothetical protein [Paracoccaceae bacterium]
MIKVNLPSSLEEASFYTEDPFTIFEIENLIEDEFYELLVADVKSRQNFDRVFSGKGNKRKFSLGGHNIKDDDESPFGSFVRYFLSQEFFDWFAATHLSKYPSNGTPYYVYNKRSSEFKRLKASNESTAAPLVFYNTEVHYSSMTQGGFIPPHTDSPKKRLSLVFYLPDEPVLEDMEKNLGTVFYRAKAGSNPWERFKSGLLNSRETQRFHDEHEVAHTTTFQRNKCAGFIKNAVSWHAVQPNQYDYDRLAIVINIVEI